MNDCEDEAQLHGEPENKRSVDQNFVFSDEETPSDRFQRPAGLASIRPEHPTPFGKYNINNAAPAMPSLLTTCTEWDDDFQEDFSHREQTNQCSTQMSDLLKQRLQLDPPFYQKGSHQQRMNRCLMVDLISDSPLSMTDRIEDVYAEKESHQRLFPNTADSSDIQTSLVWSEMEDAEISGMARARLREYRQLALAKNPRRHGVDVLNYGALPPRRRNLASTKRTTLFPEETVVRCGRKIFRSAYTNHLQNSGMVPTSSLPVHCKSTSQRAKGSMQDGMVPRQEQRIYLGKKMTKCASGNIAVYEGTMTPVDPSPRRCHKKFVAAGRNQIDHVEGLLHLSDSEEEEPILTNAGLRDTTGFP